MPSEELGAVVVREKRSGVNDAIAELIVDPTFRSTAASVTLPRTSCFMAFAVAGASSMPLR